MLSKVLLGSVLAVPALVGAALIVSSAAIAADVQRSNQTDALLSEVQDFAPEKNAQSATIETPAAPTSRDVASSSQITKIPPLVAIPAEPAVSESSLSSLAAETMAGSTEVSALDEVSVRITQAQAAPAQVAQATPESVIPATALDQLMQYGNESSNSQAQVTSITQLSDVQPTDWAYQALQSLVERYGCIAGYPDGTYKGQRAMTRFEFAAGMNACLDRISELIAASTADLATKEDLATLQRLQEEFASELGALRGRVDALEARTSELEANQFSTTTKLSGETIFAVGVPLSDDDEFEDQTIAGYRVRLNFDTSFNGEDLLRARLQARDFGDFTSFGGNASWQWSVTPTNDAVFLDDLVYTFAIGDTARVIIGANSIGDSDFVSSTVSPFDNSAQGSLTSGLGTPPQYQFIRGGTGAGALLQITDNLSFDFGYAAGGFSTSDTRSRGGFRSAGNPEQGYGLFNGDYGLISQLTFLSDFFDAAFTYSNSYSRSGFGSVSFQNLGDYTGAFSSDGEPEVANIYGAQVNFKLDFVQLGGGAMYMPVRVLDGPEQGDYRVWSYHGTLAFPDLGGDGNLLGFVFGVPPRIAGMDASLFGNMGLAAGNTRQDATFLAEAFYRLRLNDNISITPGLVWISDPGNNNDREDTFVGAVRTTFTF